jgi:hypothetical protein
MDPAEFIEILSHRVAKQAASQVYYIVRRASHELLGFTPRIVMREGPGKRPFDAIVIELLPYAGRMAMYYQGHSVEFK